MLSIASLRKRLRRQPIGSQYRSFWQVIHIDPWLLLGLICLVVAGLFILYSASNQNMVTVYSQITHIIVALLLMLILAQIPPWIYQRWAAIIYIFSLLSLMLVLIIGHATLGAQRWLNLGVIHFQPSDFMRLALPLTLAHYLANRELPPSSKALLISAVIMFVPAMMTAKEPDLGSAIVLLAGGCSILLFAGIRWRIIAFLTGVVVCAAPFIWFFLLHDYQKQRILVLLNPERDPLGAGYHIIQSKIALGSGGLVGKGWLQSSQSHLHFLPEHATDFIFSVFGQEFGLVGCTMLILLYLLITLRCFYIASQAQDNFTRLLGSSLTLLFFFSVFINIGMVTGLLPVVGLPLPLISYGGTSMATLFAGFGILMSIHSHKKMI